VPPEGLISVYDAAGRVVGQARRDEAVRSGLALGAINLLLADSLGRVLLQKRPPDKENARRWDKSVGGHVDAGEGFDAAALREAGEELFCDPRSPRVHLARDEQDFLRLLAETDLHRGVVLRREALQLNLRDVRVAPDQSVRNVVYHVAVYLGRSDVAIADYRPPRAEIAGLRYAAPAEVDAMLLRGELAPNMGFLWLAHARALQALAPAAGGAR
jgi:8-oxo-dGTP pyrophosphatase MutT (NUDIX family)